MKDSGIAWTDDTYNPIILEGGGFYCFKVSPGCTNCYAEGVSNRFNHDTFVPYKNMKDYPKLALREDLLAGWARKKKPRKNFVSSMTDVFGEFVSEEWVFKILDAMIAAPLQIFQVLTKRSKRMKDLVGKYCDLRGIVELPQNIWLIVSVENQDYVSRAVDLIATRCKVRGLSVEPLLGAVDLTLKQDLAKWCEMGILGKVGERPYMYHTIMDTKIIEHLDWVIVGGESGHKARIMKPEWAYSLLRQCRMYKVPFFFKQWGEWVGAVLDNSTGKVLFEDDGEVWSIPGNAPVFIHQDDKIADNPTWQRVSVRVGKKGRNLPRIEDTVRVSDNALLGGKNYFEFPKYLDKVA